METSKYHFISYSRLDGQAFAHKLRHKLQSANLSTWLDEQGIEPGVVFERRIAEAIANCDTLLYILTPDSIRYESFCFSECSRAFRYRKPVIPLMCADIDIKDVPLHLEGVQILNLVESFEEGVAKLIDHLSFLETPQGTIATLQSRLKHLIGNSHALLIQADMYRFRAKSKQMNSGFRN